MSTTWIYLRVSGESQAAEGKDGVNRQKEACEAVAKALEATDIEYVYDLGVSGKTPGHQRPGFLAMRRKMKRGDVLIAENLDRIGRDTIVTLVIMDDLEELGVTVYTSRGEQLRNDGESKFMREIIAATASYNRYMLVARMATAKINLKAKDSTRKTDGRYPYGHHPQFPYEAEGLRIIMAMAAERATLKAIADALWDAKIPPRGKVSEKGLQMSRWSLRTLWSIVQRERNRNAA